MANTNAVGIDKWPDPWPYGVVIGENRVKISGPDLFDIAESVRKQWDDTNRLLTIIAGELQKLANPVLVKEYVGVNPEQFPIIEGGYGTNQPRFG